MFPNSAPRGCRTTSRSTARPALSSLARPRLTALLIAHFLFAGAQSVSAQQTSPSPTTAKHRWGLLISASKYDGLTSFPSRNESMTLLKECLVQAGFPSEQVLLMNDSVEDSRMRPTRANIEKQLAWLSGQAADGLPQVQSSPLAATDEVILAIALYGVGVGATQYLCPLDCRLPSPDEPKLLEETALSVEAVRDAIAGSPASRKLLILNIYNDDPRPRARGESGDSELRSFDVNLLRPPKGYGELIGYDGREIETKDVSGFLNVIVSGLQGQADFFGGDRDGWVTLLELGGHVQRQPDASFKTAFAGSDYPLGRVQSEPPPAMTARYDVLMRLSSVLLELQMNDPAVDSSGRAVRSAPNPESASKGYQQRAAAHVGRADFPAALADAKRAEKPLTAIATREQPIRGGKDNLTTVQPGQSIRIISFMEDDNGEWIGVAVGEGANQVKGWFFKDVTTLLPVGVESP